MHGKHCRGWAWEEVRSVVWDVTLVKELGIVLTSLCILFCLLSRRVVVEDGTGEALVLCRNQHVAAILGLSLLDWEALQKCVQSRGRVSIQHGEATGTGVSGLFR